MSKFPYAKPAKTFEEQLQLLVDRGMVIDDRAIALHTLSHINYYRLSAYWIPFLQSRETNQLQPNTILNDIVKLYVFDRELRLLLLDAIERIEISFRTQWAHQIAVKYGPHAYFADRRGMRKKSSWLQANITELKAHLARSDDDFVEHYRATYQEELPPAWVSCEVMSLGLLSRWYSNLAAYPARTAITKTYGLDETVLEGVMEHLTYLRNLCAHHSRVWNRKLTKLMPLPKTKPIGLRDNMSDAEDRKLYNSLVMIAYLMDCVCIEHHWKQRLIALIESHKINTARMGFPEDWKVRDIWESDITPPGQITNREG